MLVQLLPDGVGMRTSSDVLEVIPGSGNLPLQVRLINQVRDTLFLPESLSQSGRNARIVAAIAMLKGINPADELEGMLAAHMVSTHNAAMECLGRAMSEDQTFKGREQNLKYATKLFSIYARQVEVLNTHRGKGRQG